MSKRASAHLKLSQRQVAAVIAMRILAIKGVERETRVDIASEGSYNSLTPLGSR
jgi:hypothetical protein